jgi:hypothetical protein
VFEYAPTKWSPARSVLLTFRALAIRTGPTNERQFPMAGSHPATASSARHNPHPQSSSCSIVSKLTTITESSRAIARLVLPLRS